MYMMQEEITMEKHLETGNNRFLVLTQDMTSMMAGPLKGGAVSVTHLRITHNREGHLHLRDNQAITRLISILKNRWPSVTEQVQHTLNNQPTINESIPLLVGSIIYRQGLFNKISTVAITHMGINHL